MVQEKQEQTLLNILTFKSIKMMIENSKLGKIYIQVVVRNKQGCSGGGLRGGGAQPPLLKFSKKLGGGGGSDLLIVCAWMQSRTL